MDPRFDISAFGSAWANVVHTLHISPEHFGIALRNSETSAARERALRRMRAADDARRARAASHWSDHLRAALASGDPVALAYISPEDWHLEYLQGHVKGHRRGVWSVQAVPALCGQVHRIRPERIAALKVGADTEPMHVQW
jgi:hypothetical protein